MNATSKEIPSKTYSITTIGKHDTIDISINKTDMLRDINEDSEQSGIKKTRGRPVRYTNSSKVCRIPVELVDEIKMMLQIVYPKGGVNIEELERLKKTLREFSKAD